MFSSLVCDKIISIQGVIFAVDWSVIDKKFSQGRPGSNVLVVTPNIMPCV